MYERDTNMQKLKLLLPLLPDAIKSVLLEGIPIRKVTRVQTIYDIFNNQPLVKRFGSSYATQIYLTISVTTTSAERNFSALKRLKTYLRNSMRQQPLHHCMLLHIHQYKTESLHLKNMKEELVILDNIMT